MVTAEKERTWSAVVGTGCLPWAAALAAEFKAGFKQASNCTENPLVSFCFQTDSKINPSTATACAEHSKGAPNLSAPFLDPSESKNPPSL